MVTLDVGAVGSVALDASGATLAVGGSTGLDGTLAVEAGTLSLAGTLLGGTLDPAGGTLSYAGGTLDGVTLVGPLDLSADSASVTIVDGLTQTGASPAQILDTGANSDLSYADSETLASTVITLGGNSGNYSYLYLTGTLALASTSTLDITGRAYLEGNELDNKGTITDATAGAYVAGGFGTLLNEGTVTLSDGTSNSLADTLTNTGTISVTGTGTSLYANTFENSGTVTIASDGLFEVATSTISLGTITFADDTGTLRLDDITGGYTGTLSEFRQGDLVELGGSGQTLTKSGDTLDVDQNGGAVDSFTLAGFDYTGDTFSLVTDPNGYQAITTNAPCFARGTRILTAQGERPVETLQVGDLVVTLCGQGAVLKSVRWIGHRSYAGPFLAANPQPRPRPPS